MASARIAITGLGLVTGLGLTAEENVAAVRAGRTASGPARGFPAGVAAGYVPAVDITEQLKQPKNIKLMSAPTQFAILAAKEAIAQCQASFEGTPAERIALYVGSGHTGVEYDQFFGCLEVAWQGGREQDYRYAGGRAAHLLDRYYSLRSLSNGTVAMLSTEFGARGPSGNFVQGETASAVALDAAVDDLRAGRADLALVVGCDSLTPGSVMLARRAAGLGERLAGEGAACLVLERSAFTLERSASTGVRGEICGTGFATQIEDCRSGPGAELLARAAGQASGEHWDFMVTGGWDAPAWVAAGAHVASFRRFTGDLGAATALVDLGLGLLCAGRGFLPGLTGLAADVTLNEIREEPTSPGRGVTGLFLSCSAVGQVAAVSARVLL